MEKRYGVLRVIGTLYKVIGVLIALGTVLMVILALVGGLSMGNSNYYNSMGGSFAVVLGIVMILIGGAISALGVYAIGELLYLLINLEENTRYSALLMRDRFYPQQPQPQPQPVMPMRPPVA